jgi:hypothetical protein
MAIHYKREGGLSVCGYSGYSSSNSSKIEEVTCKRCRYIVNCRQTLEIKNGQKTLLQKKEDIKNNTETFDIAV